MATKSREISHMLVRLILMVFFFCSTWTTFPSKMFNFCLTQSDKVISIFSHYLLYLYFNIYYQYTILLIGALGCSIKILLSLYRVGWISRLLRPGFPGFFEQTNKQTNFTWISKTQALKCRLFCFLTLDF